MSKTMPSLRELKHHIPDLSQVSVDVPAAASSHLATLRERAGALSSVQPGDVSGWLPQPDAVSGAAQRPLAALREIDWDSTLRDTSDDSWWPSMVSGLALGAVIGMLVALLLTPKGGREMRQLAAETLRSARGQHPDGDSGHEHAHERTLADVGLDAERDVRLRHSADYEPQAHASAHPPR